MGHCRDVYDVIINKNQNIGNFIGSQITEVTMKKKNVVRVNLKLYTINN